MTLGNERRSRDGGLGAGSMSCSVASTCDICSNVPRPELIVAAASDCTHARGAGTGDMLQHPLSQKSTRAVFVSPQCGFSLSLFCNYSSRVLLVKGLVVTTHSVQDYL